MSGIENQNNELKVQKIVNENNDNEKDEDEKFRSRLWEG